MPAWQQLCACIMIAFRNEWRGHQQPRNWSISPDILQSQQQKAFSFYFQGEFKCGLATFCIETDTRLLLFSWLKKDGEH